MEIESLLEAWGKEIRSLEQALQAARKARIKAAWQKLEDRARRGDDWTMDDLAVAALDLRARIEQLENS